MLIILAAIPVTAPGEAMLLEKLVTKVILINFIRKAYRAVCIIYSGGGRNFLSSVFFVGNVWILVGVDIQRQSKSALGKGGSAVNHTIIKA